MWSNDYIHIPFVEKGRSREGCDCWGLATVIYHEKLNVKLPLLLDYDNTKDSTHISELYEVEHQEWQEISKGEEQPFDILVFRMLGVPTHIAIVVEKGLMIHCEKGCGTHITEYNREKQWLNRLAGIYRYGTK